MPTEERAERSTEFGRIVGFTDGVIAIAITLLVLTFDVPSLPEEQYGDLAGELADQWPEYLAYGVTFAVIGRYWIIHHRFFGGLERFDGNLIALNLLFLSLIVLVPFPAEVIGEYGDTTAATVLYASVLGAVALVNWTMVTYAHGRGLVREGTLRAVPSLLIGLVFAASIPIAFASPIVAQVTWLAVFPARRLVLSRRRPSV